MKILKEIQVKPKPYTETFFLFEVEDYPEGWEYSIRVYENGDYTIHNHLGIQLFLSTDYNYEEDEEFKDKILEYMGDKLRNRLGFDLK